MQDLNPNEPMNNEGLGGEPIPATEATTEATEGAIAEPGAQVEGQQAASEGDDSK